MKKGQTSPPWSGEQLRFLRENYAEHTAAWIGRQIGRSVHAVKMQASRLGLEGRRGRPCKGDVYVRFKRNKENRKEDNQ